MSTFKRLVAAAAFAGLSAISATALADVAATLANDDYPSPAGTPFRGFDWDREGSAFTVGFAPVAGNTFDLYFFANAISITDPSGFAISTPKMDNTANGSIDGGKTYEYTFVGKLTETVLGCTASACTFQITGGTFDVYYDLFSGGGANANRTPGSLGTGFKDGVKLISGGFYSYQSTQTFDLPTATGGSVTDLKGFVSYTNGAYINPNLLSTVASSTLQLTRAAVNPGGFDGTAWGSIAGRTAFDQVFVVDANSDFFVPEPGTVALMGLALVGFAAGRRRVRKA